MKIINDLRKLFFRPWWQTIGEGIAGRQPWHMLPWDEDRPEVKMRR